MMGAREGTLRRARGGGPVPRGDVIAQITAVRHAAVGELGGWTDARELPVPPRRTVPCVVAMPMMGAREGTLRRARAAAPGGPVPRGDVIAQVAAVRYAAVGELGGWTDARELPVPPRQAFRAGGGPGRFRTEGIIEHRRPYERRQDPRDRTARCPKWRRR